MFTVRLPRSEAALDSECAGVIIGVQVITHSCRREEVKGPLTIDSNSLENVVNKVDIKLTYTEGPGTNKHTANCEVCVQLSVNILALIQTTSKVH